jgi:hypothetical protein
MKKQLTKKLVLNKETISNFEMENAKGGWPTVLYTNPICPLTIPGDGCPSRTENVYICTYTNA